MRYHSVLGSKTLRAKTIGNSSSSTTKLTWSPPTSPPHARNLLHGSKPPRSECEIDCESGRARSLTANQITELRHATWVSWSTRDPGSGWIRWQDQARIKKEPTFRKLRRIDRIGAYRSASAALSTVKTSCPPIRGDSETLCFGSFCAFSAGRIFICSTTSLSARVSTLLRCAGPRVLMTSFTLLATAHLRLLKCRRFKRAQNRSKPACQYFPAFFSAASIVASGSTSDKGASSSGSAP